MAFSFSPKIVTNGLVLYLDAANPNSYTSGSSIWKDISRAGNDGTLTNGPSYDPANGGSIVFDGVNDSVQLGKTASQLGFANSSFTVIVWFNSSNTSNDSPLFSTISGGNGNYLHYNLRSGNLHMGFYGNDTTDGPVSINRTYCACFVYDISILTQAIYVNGKLNTSAGGHNALLNGSTFQVGGVYSLWYTGKIYQVLAYNRALTASEVLQNYNTTKTRFGLN